jgi:hypothetical protein
MPDDLDDLIRGAMKTLDEQVPSGYFEALPNQTLARLEGSSMQHGSSGTTDTNPRDAMVPPPVDAVVQAKETDEDSGLHDIRNLAQSTKQRLSSRRITNSPVGNDDDVLASSSGSFRNIALPQPAAMVSLPELADLPSKQEVIAADKKAAKAAKAEKKAVAIEEVATPVVEERAAFSLPSQQNKKSKAPLFAVLGLGVAAAAGGVIYMQMQKSENKAAPAVAQIDNTQSIAPAKAAAPEPTVAPIEPPAKTEEELKAEAELEKAKADALAAEQAAAAAAANEQKVEAPKVATKAAPHEKKGKASVEAKPEKTVETKATDTKKPDTKAATTTGAGGEAEPSFDALLKEAGVADKKEKKPVLEKKSLTADDFKKGMAAVTDKAQACYKGTQGTATVKLTIAPNGSISKVSVGGAFAGKPEAACVAAAVKGATFPPWDGGPQSFTYAYMLSD